MDVVFHTGKESEKPLREFAEKRAEFLSRELQNLNAEELKVLLADVITAVQNGMDIDTATKTAYEKIYQSADTSFNYDEQFSLDTCYRDIPAVGMEMFTVARKLLLEAAVK